MIRLFCYVYFKYEYVYLKYEYIIFMIMHILNMRTMANGSYSG